MAGPASLRTSGQPADAARAFASALAQRGIECRVEGRDALAVLYPAADTVETMTDAPHRLAILELGRAYGFTHVAVAVGDS